MEPEWSSHLARLAAYFRALARQSDRMTITEVGKTNELRSMIYAIVTAPENHANLEKLRRQHLRISDPSASVEDVCDQPIVMQLGYGVHGDETSSSSEAERNPVRHGGWIPKTFRFPPTIPTIRCTGERSPIITTRS